MYTFVPKSVLVKTQVLLNIQSCIKYCFLSALSSRLRKKKE